MSSRPQREVKPIRTLANNQGRAAAEAASRAANRPKTVRRAVRPTKTVRPTTARPNNGSLPKGKDKLIPRLKPCLLYTSPSPRDVEESRMPSSA